TGRNPTPPKTGQPRYHLSVPMDSPVVSSGRAHLSAAVALFRGLADPTRLAILKRLAAGEARVVDLTNTLELPQSTVSGHLACLRDCALVTARPEGRQMFYALAQP